MGKYTFLWLGLNKIGFIKNRHQYKYDHIYRDCNIGDNLSWKLICGSFSVKDTADIEIPALFLAVLYYLLIDKLSWAIGLYFLMSLSGDFYKCYKRYKKVNDEFHLYKLDETLTKLFIEEETHGS